MRDLTVFAPNRHGIVTSACDHAPIMVVDPIMTTHIFVGPDGKAYSENKPEEGGFLSYFDGCKWLITFPVKNSLA